MSSAETRAPQNDMYRRSHFTLRSAVEFIGMIFHRPGTDVRAFGAPSDFVIDRG